MPHTNNTVVNYLSVVNQGHVYPKLLYNPSLVSSKTQCYSYYNIKYFVAKMALKTVGIWYSINGIEIALYFEESKVISFPYTIKSCWNKYSVL